MWPLDRGASRQPALQMSRDIWRSRPRLGRCHQESSDCLSLKKMPTSSPLAAPNSVSLSLSVCANIRRTHSACLSLRSTCICSCLSCRNETWSPVNCRPVGVFSRLHDTFGADLCSSVGCALSPLLPLARLRCLYIHPHCTRTYTCVRERGATRRVG